MLNEAQEILEDVQTKIVYFLDMLKQPVEPEKMIVFIPEDKAQILAVEAAQYFMQNDAVSGTFDKIFGIPMKITDVDKIYISINLLGKDEMNKFIDENKTFD